MQKLITSPYSWCTGTSHKLTAFDRISWNPDMNCCGLLDPAKANEACVVIQIFGRAVYFGFEGVQSDVSLGAPPAKSPVATKSVSPDSEQVDRFPCVILPVSNRF
jgi:hypothetical protein